MLSLKLKKNKEIQNYYYISSSGWITESGKFISCEYSKHIAILRRLCSKKLINTDREEIIEKKWIKVSGLAFYYAGENILKKQIDTILEVMDMFHLDSISFEEERIKREDLNDYFDSHYGYL